ncbi:MmgE/PrpD family protein [Rhodococcus fascians]|nr:MmgE/PrpD family protein [Rhodococcus fascians]MBY3998489.1 MmgE/PrpD family protein [Rhodococcus fascians]MBY4004517.1 MmgE/PrpD family protein [Rhodococcus fascians]MBY4009302.1 MmgE/PrpD family protein [Rhodococcus fascians]MBY4019724.1 MmgE/PrpD family protein [Rhodococcus fascians]
MSDHREEWAGVIEAATDRACLTRFEDLPAEVVAMAKWCILDTIGVAIAGSQEPVAQMVFEEFGGRDQGSTLIGRPDRSTQFGAAFGNATAAHALDFDDWAPVSGAHSSTSLVPAALAVAEEVGATGAQLITAIVAGYEFQEVIGDAVGPAHYARGFHPTGTVGVFAPALASALLMGLDPGQTRMALRVAATQAAGLKSMFGSMGKPFHAGRASSTGVLSARLAARGFVAGTGGVSGPLGFVDALGDAGPVRDANITAGRWQILDVKFKKHAACFGTYAVIEAMIALRTAGWTPENVSAVELTISPGVKGVCIFEDPMTETEAKFSPAVTGAIALAEGAVSLDTLPTYQAGPVCRLGRSVTVRFDDAMGPLHATVRLTGHNGEQQEQTADVSGRDWSSSPDELTEPLTSKFRSVSSRGSTRGSVNEILDVLLALEGLGNVRTLTNLLGATRTGSKGL